MTVDYPTRAESLAEAMSLRDAIIDVRRREAVARRVVRWLPDGWALCPGCVQSCTGQYANHLACSRCQVVLT